MGEEDHTGSAVHTRARSIRFVYFVGTHVYGREKNNKYPERKRGKVSARSRHGGTIGRCHATARPPVATITTITGEPRGWSRLSVDTASRSTNRVIYATS